MKHVEIVFQDSPTQYFEGYAKLSVRDGVVSIFEDPEYAGQVFIGYNYRTVFPLHRVRAIYERQVEED